MPQAKRTTKPELEPVSNDKVEVTQQTLEQLGIRPFMTLPISVHSFTEYAVTVPAKVAPDVLESPLMWQHCSRTLKAGSEIRVTALDGSFYARVYISYVYGTDVIARLISYVELESIDYSRMSAANTPYFVDLRQGRSWCVIKRATGEIMFGDFPSQSKAYLALEDHMRALNS